MAKIITLPQNIDERGELTVIENVFQNDYKRIYFIKNADGFIRGKHRHIESSQILTCIQGSVKVLVTNDFQEQIYNLDSCQKSLVLNPEDWHKMYDFNDNAILLVASNTKFDKEDYIQ